MTAALKPCPFCGGDASDKGVVRYAPSKLEDQNAWWADGTPVETAYYCNCVVCGANNRSAVIGGYQTQEKAIAAWNKRV